MPNYAVIGAAFGDEGKGLTVDWLCRNAKFSKDRMVVRHNGGAQAGHTVVGNNRRIVFNSLGSGSMAGVPTYYGSEFVVDPWKINEEILRFGKEPELYFNPNCFITTVWDVLINQIAEEERSKRHGSCGMGFNETIERNTSGYEFILHDLMKCPDLVIRQKMRQIRDEWVPERLASLGIDPHHGNPKFELLTNFGIFDAMIDNLLMFRDNVALDRETDFLTDYDLIFESSQGLMLDQNNDAMFPHLTRSNTGSDNIIEIADELDLAEIEVYYITRGYTTRHGAGPFAHELSDRPYEGVIDFTNSPNPWQETLRYSYLNLDYLEAAISKDWLKMTRFMLMNGSTEVTRNLVVTCMDQLPFTDVKWISGENIHTGSKLDLRRRLKMGLWNKYYESTSPTGDEICLR